MAEIKERELSPEFKQKFVIDLKGKDFIQFDGLMVLAHAEGIKGVKTRIEQFPNKENDHTAVIHATVKDANGEEWTGIGDASPQSVGKTIANAIIRMAETRAIGRALRMMLGIGTMMEEVYNPYEEPLVSNEQMGKMAKIMKKRGITREQAADFCQQEFGKQSAGTLLKSEADVFIKFLELVELPDDDQQPHQ